MMCVDVILISCGRSTERPPEAERPEASWPFLADINQRNWKKRGTDKNLMKL